MNGNNVGYVCGGGGGGGGTCTMSILCKEIHQYEIEMQMQKLIYRYMNN